MIGISIIIKINKLNYLMALSLLSMDAAIFLSSFSTAVIAKSSLLATTLSAGPQLSTVGSTWSQEKQTLLTDLLTIGAKLKEKWHNQ